eukprot:m.100829 g.100829  ORF g.100829 m.100829 type:complete len:101 (+) comp13184_c0_seq4:71-373(+)
MCVVHMYDGPRLLRCISHKQKTPTQPSRNPTQPPHVPPHVPPRTHTHTRKKAVTKAELFIIISNKRNTPDKTAKRQVVGRVVDLCICQAVKSMQDCVITI